MAVGALVALDADGPDVGQDAEGLPELAVEAGLADLVLEDRVGFPQDLEALLGRLAPDDPDRQARPREGLAPHQALGQAELDADGSNLVLEQRAQRLDELDGAAAILGPKEDEADDRPHQFRQNLNRAMRRAYLDVDLAWAERPETKPANRRAWSRWNQRHDSPRWLDDRPSGTVDWIQHHAVDDTLLFIDRRP